MKKLWDLKKVFCNLEPEGRGCGIIMDTPTSPRAILHYTYQILCTVLHRTVLLFNLNIILINTRGWKGKTKQLYIMTLSLKDRQKSTNGSRRLIIFSVGRWWINLMEKLAVQTQKVQFEYNAFTCLLNGHKKSVMVDTTSNMVTPLEFQA